MDVGRHFCKARSADCPPCPLRASCRARRESTDPREIPLMPTREKTTSDLLDLTLLRVVVRRGGSLLGYVKGKRPVVERTNRNSHAGFIRR